MEKIIRGKLSADFGHRLVPRGLGLRIFLQHAVMSVACLRVCGGKMRSLVALFLLVWATFVVSGCFPMDAPERLPVYDNVADALQAEGSVEVDVSGQGITRIPAELGDIARLERLRLRGNDLGDIGDEIGVLSGVPWLDMGRAGVQSLPDEIRLLKALHSWWLSGNGLASLPDTIVEMPSLRYLNVDRNQLERLPDDMGQMQSLRWLRLNSNDLTVLPDSITELTSLERLYVSDNALRVLPDDIGNLQALDTLVLTGNPLEEGELERVRAALPVCDVVFREIP